MARYKYIDINPRFLTVDLAKPLIPGTFEHAVHHLLAHELDGSYAYARGGQGRSRSRRVVRVCGVAHSCVRAVSLQLIPKRSGVHRKHDKRGGGRSGAALFREGTNWCTPHLKWL